MWSHEPSATGGLGLRQKEKEEDEHPNRVSSWSRGLPQLLQSGGGKGQPAYRATIRRCAQGEIAPALRSLRCLQWYDPTTMSSASVLTVINLKGGVGKTHTAWLLASVCHERGERLLIIDTDPQANLTGSLLDETGDTPGVEALFDPAQDSLGDELIRPSRLPGVDIIPSCAALMHFDLADQVQWEQTDLHFSLVELVDAVRPHYDWIVFDCPPRLSLVSFAALCASDGVIIPMEAADWGAQGIMQVTEAIEYVRERFNDRLTLLGYLVSRFKRARSYQQSYLTQLRGHFGALAFDTVVPDLARFEKSVTDRIPITQHAPGSEEAAVARTLVDEIQRRAQGIERRSDRRRETSVYKIPIIGTP